MACPEWWRRSPCERPCHRRSRCRSAAGRSWRVPRARRRTEAATNQVRRREAETADASDSPRFWRDTPTRQGRGRPQAARQNARTARAGSRLRESHLTWTTSVLNERTAPKQSPPFRNRLARSTPRRFLALIFVAACARIPATGRPARTRRRTGKRMQRSMAATVCAALVLGMASACAQPSDADFYKGNKIRVLVGTTPGAGYDLIARLVAAHLGKHIPGNPSLVVEYMPGAGSLTMSNYLYNRAARD